MRSAFSRFIASSSVPCQPRVAHASRRGLAIEAGGTRTGRPWGVVLDIDGVLIRGPEMIPGSAAAVRKLMEAEVPVAFMTNGGGVLESVKSRDLAKWLDIPSINESQVLLSHTPMRDLAERFRGRRVLLVGSSDTVGVAAHYGFDVAGGMAVTSSQIAAGTRGLHVRSVRHDDVRCPPIDINADGIPIEAVLIFYDSADWLLDLQVVTDVLRGGVPLGSGKLGAQAAEVFASNPDFVWKANYSVPRFGGGAFVECVRTLWRRTTGGLDLQVTEFGKPHKSQFDAAKGLISSLANGARVDDGEDLRRLYMIGDNPAADIRGANGAGEPWRSILVCTGVYGDGASSNDARDPAWRVEADLASAVDVLLRMSEAEHVC